ncbi:Mpo1 family 2-hydroxy fatty acid dioxygenase [Aliikangiella sp. IMCC44359]|uniref:Mpo1 family 2-hydroxy fatty acid dioxygenase n=1 Tax=Aliikangiella sp. IMCC44359 TaxID=3459125 RepID=UPI00403AA743
MKNIAEQLSTYKSVHLNPKNVRTHFLGVPMIIWSIALLMSLVSWPVSLFDYYFSISLAFIFFAVVFLYYIVLHWRLAIGLFLFIVPVLYSAKIVAAFEYALFIAIGVFVIGWVIQFIGHYYEKAKPAFVDDLNQLFIGPIFLMAEVYFLLGWEKELESKITPMAVEKRKAFQVRNKV